MSQDAPSDLKRRHLGSDFPTLATLVRDKERVLITSHVQADGDAVGSTVALALGLQRCGKTVRIVLNDLPAKYTFLGDPELLEIVSEAPKKNFFSHWDLGVLLDASVPSRVGVLQEGFFGAQFPRICLDHHLADSEPAFTACHIDSQAPSTGSLVLKLLDEIPTPVDRQIAEALFVALATDTGWFRFANTNPEALHDAARLVAVGVDPERLYRLIYEQLSFSRVTLQGEVLTRAQRDLEGLLIWSYLDQALLKSSGVARADLEGLIDPLRVVKGSEVAALLTETATDTWKVSLRSHGRVNVQSVARRLGGGGHAKAAGAEVSGNLPSVTRTLKKEIKRALE